MTKLEGEERVKAAGCSFTIVRTRGGLFGIWKQFPQDYIEDTFSVVANDDELI